MSMAGAQARERTVLGYRCPGLVAGSEHHLRPGKDSVSRDETIYRANESLALAFDGVAGDANSPSRHRRRREGDIEDGGDTIINLLEVRLGDVEIKVKM